MQKKTNKKTNKKKIQNCYIKNEKDPVAYDILYNDYETIEKQNSDIESESDISELESEISDKNDNENILKEVEEMNNKYSFLIQKKQKNTKSKENSIELKEEEYISD